MKPILLFLTCANKQEANKITRSLLEKKLVACVKKIAVNSDYLWRGKIEKAREILLIMESEEKLFTKIEKEVKFLHSYEMPVLVSVPVLKASAGIANWLNEELK